MLNLNILLYIMFIIRKVVYGDYDKIIALLVQLTQCTCSRVQFYAYLEALPENEHIYILESNNIVVATGKLMVETKIIRDLRSVGHIEDIVVDEQARGSGFGKALVSYLITLAKDLNCYKVILDCDEPLRDFYKSCDLIDKGIQMGKYF